MKQIYILLIVLVATLLFVFVPAKPYEHKLSGGTDVGWPVRMEVQTRNELFPISFFSTIVGYIWAIISYFVVILVIIEVIVWLKNMLI